uniref:formate--tetrahydrofolate ligase n=1 Tax=Coccolithus braarudii TaxID=221442 RepID=A0A7S0L0K8_9EUKA|mmetsp:Transcript_1362/g.2935  ORF Transcript_1362/g.2935 Transcript_1362/m.2935 type:complete len:680 (+) Transcript_1362:14-2053(+)
MSVRVAMSVAGVASALAAAALAIQRLLARQTRSGLNKLTLMTPVPPDVEISQAVQLTPIRTLFSQAFGLTDDELFPHGLYKGKLSLAVYDRLQHQRDGHYVVVCGITPTPLGEGKSTTTVGLSQALGAHLGQKVVTCIRQPSMGPTFGIKGGAAGGGYAQCAPMEEFNLHMTGDIHAITAANNLFAAAIDTRYLHEQTASRAFLWEKLCPPDGDGKRVFEQSMRPRLAKLGIDKTDPNTLSPDEIDRFVKLDIDPDTITWKRVTDTNDRYLRQVEIGASPTEVHKKTGESLGRTAGFAITVASEIMAVLALATDLADLRTRLGRMIACFSRSGEPLTADDFGITGALTVLLMDALMPTTMQTLEGTPTLVHCGPFANIAHGNSSIVADRLALKLVGPKGYVLTEAGFGSDMGGEKFFNIKCFYSGLKPSAAVLVCTVRALKLHSCEAAPVVPGAALAPEYRDEALDLVRKGGANMLAHIRNITKHGVKVVVAINRFHTDTDAEVELVATLANEGGAFAAVQAEHFAKGGAGAVALGRALMAACEAPDTGAGFRHLYDAKSEGVKQKIETIVREVYGGVGATYSPKAEERISQYEADPSLRCLPICMSKTQYSLSDDAKKLGAPSGFAVTVKDVYVSAGAGFIVVSLGAISFIPGLPIKPAYYKIDLDMSSGTPKVVGLS